ncbi:tetratricopeptide repeat protein [Streptomyces mirabilis]
MEWSRRWKCCARSACVWALLGRRATLSARNNLAGAYNDAGRVQDALDLGERVLADYERILGHDHPDTLTARNNLTHTRDVAAAVQQPDTATPAIAPALQPPSDAPEQPV